MRRYVMRMLPAVILALLLVQTGCGDSSKKDNPKLDSNAPKLQEKTPGGPGAPKKGSPE